jgi:hypothetical protein
MASRLSERALRAKQRAIEATYLMRSRGYSLTKAAREAHIDRRTVRKYVPSVLVQEPSGHYQVKPGDNLAAYMHYLTPEGVRVGAVRGSRNRSMLAEYSAAIDHFLITADYSKVQRFRGTAIRIDGELVPFLTDKQILRRLGNAGETSFTELYKYA